MLNFGQNLRNLNDKFEIYNKKIIEFGNSLKSFEEAIRPKSLNEENYKILSVPFSEIDFFNKNKSPKSITFPQIDSIHNFSVEDNHHSQIASNFNSEANRFVPRIIDNESIERENLINRIVDINTRTMIIDVFDERYDIKVKEFNHIGDLRKKGMAFGLIRSLKVHF
jgi:F0F1-type ATP synthase gamma subunit